MTTRQEAQRAVVTGLLKKGIEILETKNQDYAVQQDGFSNFNFTGMVLDCAVEMGVVGTHLAFIALIATKMARMMSLLGEGKKAKNETITDTCVDMANYAALWGGYILAGNLVASDKPDGYIYPLYQGQNL